jgi:hypothetical protein
LSGLQLEQMRNAGAGARFACPPSLPVLLKSLLELVGVLVIRSKSADDHDFTP